MLVKKRVRVRAGWLLGFALLAIPAHCQSKWAHQYGDCPPWQSCNRTLLANPEPILAEDGGLILASPAHADESGYSIVQLLRLDPHGNLSFARSYIEKGTAFCAIAGPSQNTVIAAMSFDDSDPNVRPSKFYVFGCDKGGTVRWSKEYIEAGNWYSGLRTSDGNLLIMDDTSNLVKVNSQNGSLLWVWGYYIPFLAPGRAFTSRAVTETPDQGLAMLLEGHTDGLRILKTNSEGDLLWCQRYPELALQGTDKVWFKSTGDGGFVFAGRLRSASGESVVVRMDNQGSVLWAKRAVWAGDTNPWSLGLRGAVPASPGKFLVHGGASYFDDQGTVKGLQFLAQINDAGSLEWSHGWMRPTPGVSAIIPVDDGFLLPGSGGDYAENYSSMTLLKLNREGHAPGCRAEWPGVLRLEDTAVTAVAEPGFVRETNPYAQARDAQIQSREVIDIPDRVICGEAFPGVMSVKTLKNPLQLKLVGWNFQKGSQVLIDGKMVSKSTFKGSDKLGKTTLMASGSGLKKLLPKGQSVCLTVRNPDGHESVCYAYIR